MPGAIANPLNNPEASYQQYSHDYTPGSYQAQADRGYKWNGTGWDYTGGGTTATDAMKKADPSLSGLPSSAGKSGPATTSLATGSSVSGSGGTGPYKADAQLAQIRDDFRRMTDSGVGAINEDMNQRGIFSSGVGAKIEGDYRTQMGQQEGSAIERLMNDIMGRNQQSELAKQQFEWQKQLAMMGGGSQRYGDSGNDEMMKLFQQMMGGTSAPGYDTSGKAGGGGGGSVAGGSTSPAGPMRYGDAEWKAEQARIKKLLADREAAKTANSSSASDFYQGTMDFIPSF